MQKNINEKRIFILEGNIGAGKSTLLRLIKEHIPGVGIIFEPTDKWQSVGEDGNILDLFYKDGKRWSYTFQSYAFISRIKSQMDYMSANPDINTIFIERSVYSDRYCFAKGCFESEIMSALEWQIYKEWFSWLVGDYMKTPAGFIYLNTTPETCFSRLKKRGRSEEVGVSLDYLKSLHNKHDDWLLKKIDIEKALENVSVLDLDCNEDFESSESLRHMHIAKLNEFISNSHSVVLEKELIIQKQF